MKETRIQKRRHKILEASLTVFAKQGYFQSSIADIAKYLKIGHGTFYRYFESKQDIFASLLQTLLEKVSHQVLEEAPEESDTLQEYADQITRIGRRLFQLFTDNPAMAQVLFYEVYVVDDASRQTIDNAMSVVNRITEAYLINGIEKGFLKDDIDSLTAAKAINNLLIAAIKEVMNCDEKNEAYARWEGLISSFIINGLGRI